MRVVRTLHKDRQQQTAQFSAQFCFFPRSGSRVLLPFIIGRRVATPGAFPEPPPPRGCPGSSTSHDARSLNRSGHMYVCMFDVVQPASMVVEATGSGDLLTTVLRYQARLLAVPISTTRYLRTDLLLLAVMQAVSQVIVMLITHC